MRFLFLVSSLLLACQTHTLPIGAMPAYAQNHPVLTREGYALALEDGGRVDLVAREGVCLKRLGYAPSAQGAIAVGEGEGDKCRTVAVNDVEAVIAGEQLLIRGAKESIEVDPQLVEAVRIVKPELEPTFFAPRTGPRSVGLVVGGSLLMAAGVAGSIALFTAAANVDGDGFDEIGRVLLATYGGAALAGGVGGGIPMIVIGARQIRLPQAEQPFVRGLQLGSGLGLGWALE